MMLFHDEVKAFLKKENIAFSEKYSIEFKSIFQIIFLIDHQIVLHCIALQHPSLKNISPDYFSKFCDNAVAQNVRIINLWEDVWQLQNELVRSRILALCGISKRIHARQTKIVRIDKKVADDFLNANHLQQNVNAYYKYGLYKLDELVAVATFSKSRVMTDSSALYRSFELVRFASLRGTTVNGGLGKLLNYFIEQHHPAHIMTYADRDWSNGNSYIKMGFTLIENTQPLEFFIHPKEMIRYHAHSLPTKFSSIEEMTKAGYIKIYNAGNAKFILDRRNG